MKIECKNESWRRKKVEDHTENKRNELIKIHYFTINKHKHQWSSLLKSCLESNYTAAR